MQKFLFLFSLKNIYRKHLSIDNYSIKLRDTEFTINIVGKTWLTRDYEIALNEYNSKTVEERGNEKEKNRDQFLLK